MDSSIQVPESVRIFHHRAGRVHIFTSRDLRGLHVGHADLGTAFELITEAVSGLVRLNTGVEAFYEPEMTFEEFRAHVEGEGDIDLLAPVMTVKVSAPQHV